MNKLKPIQPLVSLLSLVSHWTVYILAFGFHPSSQAWFGKFDIELASDGRVLAAEKQLFPF